MKFLICWIKNNIEGNLLSTLSNETWRMVVLTTERERENLDLLEQKK